MKFNLDLLEAPSQKKTTHTIDVIDSHNMIPQMVYEIPQMEFYVISKSPSTNP